MFELWRQIFLFPLLNGLILLYETVAFGNLGVAVIELTVLIRLLLFPLTVIAERNKAKYERLEEEVERIQDAYKDDPVAMRERVRDLLHAHRISPWAKASILAIQGLVLIAIYQVFMKGLTASLTGLYSWVPRPRLPINTMFFGADVGQRDLWAALAVGVVLFATIVVDQRKHVNLLGRQDAIFRYAFPAAVVVILSLLPMVKALFVLTSVLFTVFISFIRHRLWPTGQVISQK